MQRHLNQTGSGPGGADRHPQPGHHRKLEQVQTLDPGEAADLLGLAADAAPGSVPAVLSPSPAQAASETAAAPPRLRRRAEDGGA